MQNDREKKNSYCILSIFQLSSYKQNNKKQFIVLFVIHQRSVERREIEKNNPKIEPSNELRRISTAIEPQLYDQ